MAARVKIEGLKELDAALGELSKGAARGVLRRTLIKAGEPMRAAAERLAPRDTGDLAASIEISSKIDNRAGKAEYASVMRGGGTKAEAVQALRDARRSVGVAGRLSTDTLLTNLAQEWASLPTPKGKGYYSGQRASVTVPDVKPGRIRRRQAMLKPPIRSSRFRCLRTLHCLTSRRLDHLAPLTVSRTCISMFGKALL